MKKISIVTPVYKAEAFIAYTINSVIDQTYSNIELLLFDDKGGDRSIEIAEKILSKVHKKEFSYRILSTGKNEGVSVARNICIRQATGDFIFCLDSDDTIKSDCIEKLVCKAEKTNADITICGHYSDIGREHLGGHLSLCKDLLENNSIIKAFSESIFNVAPWCKLMKRDFIISNNLFFPPQIINEDEPWCFLLCLYANRMAFVHEDLYFYRYNSNSIMSTLKKEKEIEAQKVCLSIYNKEIYSRPETWNNKYIYILYMKEVVKYYTSCIENSKRYIYTNINIWEYPCAFFSFMEKNIPMYYRLWNFAFPLPVNVQKLYLRLLIKTHSLTKKATSKIRTSRV